MTVEVGELRSSAQAGCSLARAGWSLARAGWSLTQAGLIIDTDMLLAEWTGRERGGRRVGRQVDGSRGTNPVTGRVGSDPGGGLPPPACCRRPRSWQAARRREPGRQAKARDQEPGPVAA